MYKSLLCLRYLRTRYIALASIISVMLGVATMIVVNSVMAGFSNQMRDRIHGILADVVVETINLDGVPDVDQQVALVKQACGDKIEAVTGTVEIYGILNFQYGTEWITRPVTLIGIEPDEKAQVGPLVDYLRSYKVVSEGGKYDREALRDRSEAPGWTLTAPAAERRRIVKTRQQLYLDANRGPGVGPVPAPQAPVGLVSRTTTDAASEPTSNAVPNFDLESDPDEVQDVAVPEGDPLMGPADEAVTPDIFNDPDMLPDGFEDPEPVDITELQDAKVYVGLGLISFPRENPETGEVYTELLVQPGDDVVFSTVTAGTPPEPSRFQATVVDIFQSGMSEYDGNYVFCNREALQRARGMFDNLTETGRINNLQIKLKDYHDAPEVVQRLRAVFPPHMYSVRTWEDKQGALLAAVEVEQTILNVLLFLIIAVAGFGILAIFFMIVVEKTRDIGIMRALGAGSGGVMSVFLSYGLALGVVGSGVGVVCGLLFVKYINEIEAFLTWVTGRKVFDQRIYYFPEIPTRVETSMVLWVAFGALAIAVLASILPARRAAQLHPVDALRHE